MTQGGNPRRRRSCGVTTQDPSRILRADIGRRYTVPSLASAHALLPVWRESTSVVPSQFVMAPWTPLLLHALRPGPSALAPLFELARRHPFPVDLNRRAAALKAALEHAAHRPGAALQRLLEHPLERPLRFG